MLGLTLILPLMIILIVGSLLRKYNFYSENDLQTLSKTLYWIVLPPLLFSTTYKSGKEVLGQSNLLTSLIICYLLTIVIAGIFAYFCIHKGQKERIAVSVFSSIRSNNIYLGFPVMFMALGEVGLENASIYIAVCTIPYHLISLIAGEIMLSGKITMEAFSHVMKRLIKNPLLASCFLGIFFALVGPDKLPRVFDTTMKMMGNSATAIALLALGGSLELSKVTKIMKMLKRTWFDCLIKLIVHPAILYLTLTVFPVPTILMQTTVMISAMPTAVNCFIMAKEMNMDGDYAADLVAASVILSAISIPFWASFLKLI
ncbi:MAG: AEC family transporter [Synergistaceae bacterium]